MSPLAPAQVITLNHDKYEKELSNIAESHHKSQQVRTEASDLDCCFVLAHPPFRILLAKCRYEGLLTDAVCTL